MLITLLKNFKTIRKQNIKYLLFLRERKSVNILNKFLSVTRHETLPTVAITIVLFGDLRKALKYLVVAAQVAFDILVAATCLEVTFTPYK